MAKNSNQAESIESKTDVTNAQIFNPLGKMPNDLNVSSSETEWFA